MNIRLGNEKDYSQLAEMKWQHCKEDDEDYGEHNLDGVNKTNFINDFITFLKLDKSYSIFVAEKDDKIVSALCVAFIPKLPKANSKSKYIGYLTNVFTLKEYRNKGIGSKLISFAKSYAQKQNCELLFVWPSEKSFNFYKKNDFKQENEICECVLMDD